MFQQKAVCCRSGSYLGSTQVAAQEAAQRATQDFMYLSLGENMYIMDEGMAVAQLLCDAACEYS